MPYPIIKTGQSEQHGWATRSKDVAPAHIRGQPAWITRLINLACASFKPTSWPESAELFKLASSEEKDSFTMEVPLWAPTLAVFCRGNVAEMYSRAPA